MNGRESFTDQSVKLPTYPPSTDDRRVQLMGGVFHADPDAERLVAAQVGKQRAVLFVRVVAQGCAEAAAQQGQATEELLAVEGRPLWGSCNGSCRLRSRGSGRRVA